MAPSTTLSRFIGTHYTPELVSQFGRRRGMGVSTLRRGKCLCDRPHCRIICHVCGYLGWGRLRFSCPEHPQTIFLIDMSQCPKCRAYAFMMSEF